VGAAPRVRSRGVGDGVRVCACTVPAKCVARSTASESDEAAVHAFEAADAGPSYASAFASLWGHLQRLDIPHSGQQQVSIGSDVV
jgi:hypothetical protein